MEIVGEYRDFITGEIKAIREGDSCRILRRESKDYLSSTMKKIRKDGSGFIMMFVENQTELYKLLGGACLGLLSYLTQFVSYGSCELKHCNGKYITNDYIMQELGMTKPTLLKHITTLVDNEIIYKKKVGRCNVYIMNPYICVKGDYIDSEVYDYANKSRWSCRLYEKRL